jgi:hypothetical protein
VGSAQRVGARRFTLEQYLDLPHAVVKTWQGQQTFPDRPLSELGLKRRVALITPLLCADNLRHRSYRPGRHRAPQIGQDNDCHGCGADGGAAARDQKLSLLYGMAPETH